MNILSIVVGPVLEVKRLLRTAASPNALAAHLHARFPKAAGESGLEGSTLQISDGNGRPVQRIVLTQAAANHVETTLAMHHGGVVPPLLAVVAGAFLGNALNHSVLESVAWSLAAGSFLCWSRTRKATSMLVWIERIAAEFVFPPTDESK